jgi:hypothetical protein
MLRSWFTRWTNPTPSITWWTTRRLPLKLRRKGCLVLEEPFDIAIGKCAVIQDQLGNMWSILDMSKGPRPTEST